jgi:hypothetical protein
MDDDGRAFMFWGSSNQMPIREEESDPKYHLLPIAAPMELFGHDDQLCRLQIRPQWPRAGVVRAVRGGVMARWQDMDSVEDRSKAKLDMPNDY